MTSPLLTPDRVLENAVLDGVDSLLTPAQKARRAEIDRMAPDGGAASRARMGNVMFLARETGRPAPEIGEAYDYWRALYSRSKFDGEGSGDENGFTARVKKEMGLRRSERHLLEGDGTPEVDGSSLQQTAVQAALDGKPWSEAYSIWTEGNQSRPGWRGDRLAGYEAAGERAHAEMSAKIEAARPIVDQIMTGLRSERENSAGYGTEDTLAPVLAAPKELRPVIYSLLHAEAGKEGEAKEEGWQLWQAFGRGSAGLLTGTARTVQTATLKAAQVKLDTLKPGDTYGGRFDDFASFLMEKNTGAAETDIAEFLAEPLLKNKVVTAEDITTGRARLAQEWDRLQVAADVEDIGKGLLDPIKPANWMARKVWYPFAEGAAPFMAAGAMGVGSTVLMYGSIADQRTREIQAMNPGMALDKASLVGGVSAIVETGLEYAQARLALGGAGSLGKTAAALKAAQAGFGKQLLRNVALGAVEQNAMEALQDLTPHVTQALMSDMPDVDWGKVLNGENGYWAQRADTFFALLPAVIGGAGLKSASAKFSRPKLESLAAGLDDITLKAAGIVDSVRTAILSESDPVKRLSVLDSALTRPDPETAKAGRQELEARTAAAAAIAEEMKARAGVRELRRTDHGWEIVRTDGKKVPVSSPQAAEAMMNDLGQAADKAEAEALVGIADAWHAANAENSKSTTTFTGAVARGTKEGVTYTRGGETVREITDPGSLANLYEEARMDGAEEINVLVNGSNRVFADRVADGAARVVKELEVNQGGQPAVVTLLHEQVESNLRAGMLAGAVTTPEMMSALNFAAAALPENSLPASDKEGRGFRQRVMRGAMGELSDGEMRETIVELAVADIIGRRKDGGTMPAGAVTRALTSALHAAVNPVERAAIGKFRALLRSVRAYLRGVMGTVAGLAKARRDGTLGEGNTLDPLIDKLTGRDQQAAHNAAVVKDAESTGSDPADASFSLSSVSALEAVAARIENRMAEGGPEAKLNVLGDMARTLSGMARAARHNEEVENVLAAGKIEERRRVMRRELLDRYTIEVLESPAGGALLMDQSLSLHDMPVLGQVLDRGKSGLHGIFLGPAKAKKQGRQLAGEYDDAAGLPGWLWRGDQTPDEVATSLGMDVAQMWSAIHDELAPMERMRSNEISARRQMAEARVRASREASEWASSERAKLASSDARDARRALIALDSMIMKLPAEVRKSVGGFTPVSDLTTNAAREKYFLRAVDRIDRALERHLRKTYRDRLFELFAKGKVRMAVGEGDKGRLGVNGHTWFQRAEEIMKTGSVPLAEREAWVESRLSGAKDLTEDDITDLNRRWDFGEGEEGARLALDQEQALLDLFGGLLHDGPDGSPLRTASEMESAMKAAEETLSMGRNAWEARIVERRAWRVARQLTMQNELGVSGLPDEIAAREKALQGWDGTAADFFQKGFSFEQLVGDIVGRETATHRYAEETTRNAEMRAKADWMDRQQQFQAFVSSLWPKSGRLARLRNLETLATRRKVPGAPEGMPEMSELEAIHYTMLWSDSSSREWLEQWKFGDDAQAAMEGFLSPAAKEIRRWLEERYDAQYDEINSVYRRLYGVNMPRVANYAPRLVDHGKQKSVADPLSPGVAEGMGISAGFTKRRRPTLSAMPLQVDALSAYWMNQRVTGHWRAWAEPMRELRALFSTSRTQPLLKAAAGAKAATMLNQWLTLLEQNGNREMLSVDTLRRWISANADNALVGKLGVLGKQIPASYGSAAEIGWGDWLKSVSRIASGEASITLTDIFNSPVMRQRRWSDLPEVLNAARGTGTHPFAKMLRRVGVEPHAIDLGQQWMRERIGWTDAFFSTLSAAAAYDAHFRDAIAAGGVDAEARATAEERAAITVSRTAQPDSIVNKSLFENGLGTWGRLFFAFQSANRQALFMTAAAFRDGGIKSKAAWRKALTHWLLTGLITQTVGNVVRDIVSDDEPEEIWESGDYGRAMLLGPLTGALYFGPLVDAVGGLLGGFERRQAAGPAGALGDGGRVLIDAITEDEAVFDTKAADKVARAMGLFLGGKATSLNMMANVFKQMEGAADNVVTTPEEEIERKAKAQRKADKALREAFEQQLTPKVREQIKEGRQARKEELLQRDALRFDAINGGNSPTQVE